MSGAPSQRPTGANSSPESSEPGYEALPTTSKSKMPRDRFSSSLQNYFSYWKIAIALILGATAVLTVYINILRDSNAGDIGDGFSSNSKKHSQIEPTPESVIPILGERTPPVAQVEENYLMPALDDRQGASNYLMALQTAASIARALNRTLCVTDMTLGPRKHQLDTKNINFMLKFEERYNLSDFSRFVKIAHLEKCMQSCGSRLDTFYTLEDVSGYVSSAWKNISTSMINGKKRSWRWKSYRDIAADMKSRTERCLAVGGLFPGLRWRGAFLASGNFLEHTDKIKTTARTLVKSAIGNSSYIAVHWRFRESRCGGINKGMCFHRCHGGATPAMLEVHSPHPNWRNFTKCSGRGQEASVIVRSDGIAWAIIEQARKLKVQNIYISTDARLRSDGCNVLKKVVQAIRRKSFTVFGFWSCPNIVSFSMKQSPHPQMEIGNLMGLKQGQNVGNHIMSHIEQEICIRGKGFMGSAISTWSMVVQRKRLASRRSKAVRERQKRDKKLQAMDTDQLVVDSLVKDDFNAGVICEERAVASVWHKFKNKVVLSRDDFKDKWLDTMACEGRLAAGGRCTVAVCL